MRLTNCDFFIFTVLCLGEEGRTFFFPSSLPSHPHKALKLVPKGLCDWRVLYEPQKDIHPSSFQVSLGERERIYTE